MAPSPFPTTLHDATQFVESAGCILFNLSTSQICLLHLHEKDEFLLPKGRRNVGETRGQAALREVKEETGLSCRLLPITMASRVPPAVETEPFGDVVRTHENVTEPFSLQIRHLETKGHVKLVWWFVAAIEKDGVPDKGHLGEERFIMGFYSYADAVEKLTFQEDRDMVLQAINTVKATYH
ncbi:hypothetical protein P7C71_g3601, partial [Lecanoromycetidae sp. Uapishka_2]